MDMVCLRGAAIWHCDAEVLENVDHLLQDDFVLSVAEASNFFEEEALGPERKQVLGAGENIVRRVSERPNRDPLRENGWHGKPAQ